MDTRSRGEARQRSERRAAVVALALSVGLIGGLGCDPRQAVFFLQPFDPVVPPAYAELKGKKVVVLAKAAPGATGEYVGLDREINRQVVQMLRQEVKKIEVVDPEKVYDWDRDHPTWTDPGELAEAFDADAVVFFEINKFQIESPSSPGMFEGRSAVHVRVVTRSHPKDDRGRDLVDQPKFNEIVYDADRDTVFPSRGPMPASAEVSAPIFKGRFVKLVANELAWNFIGHAPGDEIQDAKF
jgi:hypothetical protein